MHQGTRYTPRMRFLLRGPRQSDTPVLGISLSIVLTMASITKS